MNLSHTFGQNSKRVLIIQAVGSPLFVSGIYSMLRRERNKIWKMSWNRPPLHKVYWQISYNTHEKKYINLCLHNIS